VVEVYRTVAVELERDLLGRAARADAICFASSSAVSSFVAQAGADGVPGVVVCIGPATAATARKLGLAVTAEAGERSMEALAEALVHALVPGHPH
jgi:uroporphyrinogen-III synthase